MGHDANQEANKQTARQKRWRTIENIKTCKDNSNRTRNDMQIITVGTKQQTNKQINKEQTNKLTNHKNIETDAGRLKLDLLAKCYY